MRAMSYTNTAFPAPAGPVPAYFATPTGTGPWPGVVILHEGFGMTRDIVRITDRFAANGYLSISPWLFHRGNKIACIVRTFQASGLFDASAPNYGDWPKSVSSLPNSCPTVASYGAKDRLLKGAADKLESLLAEGDVPRDIKEYSDVGHCFMNDLETRGPLRVIQHIARMSYSAPEAEDAWQRIFAFFGEHLG